MFEVRTPGTKKQPPWCSSRDHDFTNTLPTPSRDVSGPISAKLPWILRERPNKKNRTSPERPATNPIRAPSFTQDSLEACDESLRSLSIDEVPSTTELNPPLHDHSPPSSERSSTPSTITPLTYKMTADAGMMRDTGSDGDDEKSPTFGRIMQIPRKSVGSGCSKALSKKDTTQTPDCGASGGDGSLRGFFRKKEWKAKDFISDSAKGKAAEQDEGNDDIVTLKVS